METTLSLVALIGIVSSFFNTHNPVNEIHISPDNFKSVVMIIHNQKDGENIIKAKGNIVYKIPPNGIVRTKNPLVEGLRLIEYYYDTKPNKTGLMFTLDLNLIPTDTNCVFAVSTGTYGASRPNEVDATTYLVGSKKDADSLAEALQKWTPFELLEKKI